MAVKKTPVVTRIMAFFVGIFASSCLFITNINKLIGNSLTTLFNGKQKLCLFLKDFIFKCLTDDLLSSFDYVKSLPTSKGKQQPPAETTSRMGLTGF
ncbi:MAG: hypothetical protein ABS69_02710 [Nitrosomonadales bacterium SCN 54-20]|nr:MAG: hypothetical protein ABS69_02710 [Nitrosomonadales bacterium SCN 54-20]